MLCYYNHHTTHGITNNFIQQIYITQYQKNYTQRVRKRQEGISEVKPELTPKDFYHPNHRMCKMRSLEF